MNKLNHKGKLILDIDAGDRVCIRKTGSAEERYVWARDNASGCFTVQSEDVKNPSHEGIHITGVCAIPHLIASDEWWELVEIEKSFRET